MTHAQRRRAARAKAKAERFGMDAMKRSLREAKRNDAFRAYLLRRIAAVAAEVKTA